MVLKAISDRMIAGDLEDYGEPCVAVWLLHEATMDDLAEVAAAWSWIESRVVRAGIMRTGKSLSRKLPDKLAMAIGAIYVKEKDPRPPARLRRRPPDQDSRIKPIGDPRRPSIALLDKYAKAFNPQESLVELVDGILFGK